MSILDFSGRTRSAAGHVVFASMMFFLYADRALALQQSDVAVPPASAPAAPAPKVYAQAYGDWVYRCVSVPQAGQAARVGCEVMQQMVLNRGGKNIPLLTLAFVRGANAVHLMNVVAPLGVLLQPGIALSVDADSPVHAPYAFCNDAGCWSLDQSAEGMIGQLHDGKLGHARILLPNGKNVTINFSLNGALPALAALDSGVLPAHVIGSKAAEIVPGKPAS